MSKRISASDAKNNFGGLLEDVASLGRVEIVRHGRLVAVVLAPRELESLSGPASSAQPQAQSKHMIPAHIARAARIVHEPMDFDDD